MSSWAGTLRDDFEDGDLDGWQGEFANGKVEEKDGKLIITDINRDEASLVYFNEGQKIGDFTLTVDVNMSKADAGNTYLWVTFRYVGTWDNGKGSGSFAYLCYEANNSTNVFSIFRWQGGNWEWDVAKVNILLNFRVGQWYHIKMEMKGKKGKLWIDDELKVQTNWENQADLSKEGKIALGGGGGEFHFDNLVIISDDIQPVQPKSRLTTTWGRLKQ